MLDSVILMVPAPCYEFSNHGHNSDNGNNNSNNNGNAGNNGNSGNNSANGNVNQSGAKDNNANSSTPNGGAGQNTVKAIKTGDTANFALYGIVMVAAGAVITTLVYRRKRS